MPGAEVLTWPEPAWARRNERFNAMAKPAYPVFARHVRRFMAGRLRGGRSRGGQVDLAHPIMPQAVRYRVAMSLPMITKSMTPMGWSM